MPVVLAVDPGLRVCGVSLFVDGALAEAKLLRGDAKSKDYPRVWKYMAASIENYIFGCPKIDELVIEMPMVYPQRHLQKGDPNDLMELAAAVGGIVMTLCVPTTRYYPRDWKRQLPNEIVEKRVAERLSSDEKAKIEWCNAKSLRHNISDSIGIGLHHHRRCII